jgi:hypothetical protein
MSETKQAAYRRRQAERGLSQCVVWAPKRDHERIRRYAAGLSKTFEKEQRSAERGSTGS